MFLKEKQSGDLVRIKNLEVLIDPMQMEVAGRDQSGEEEQDWTMYSKDKLIFPSGEELPRCWIDPNYQLTHSREFAVGHYD